MVTELTIAILKSLWSNEELYGKTALVDINTCVAVSNDCLRMIERVDAMIESLTLTYTHLPWDDDEIEDTNAYHIQQKAADLVNLYGRNAVYASQRIANFILESIQTSSVPAELFSSKWEDELVQNEIAMSITRTIEDHLSNIRKGIEQDFLYHKVVAALVRSTVCFYIQCFINKAHRMRMAMKLDIGGKRRERIAFNTTNKAIWRIYYDVEVFQDYFLGLAKDNVSLRRIIMNELYVLSILVECMWLAAGETSDDSFANFVVLVHKRTGADSIVTKNLLSDLWLLVGPKNDHRVVESAVHTMQEELQLVSTRLQEKDEAKLLSSPEMNEFSCLKLDTVLKDLYHDRVFQEKSSLCANILRDVKEFRQSIKIGDKSHSHSIED